MMRHSGSRGGIAALATLFTAAFAGSAAAQQLADYYFTSSSATSAAQVRTTSGTSNLQNGSGARAFNPLTNTTGVWSSSLATKSLLVGPVSVGGSGTAGFVSFGSTGGGNNPTMAGLIFGAAQVGGYAVIGGGTSSAATNSVTLGAAGSVGIPAGTGLVVRGDVTGTTSFRATNAAGARLRVILGADQVWTNDSAIYPLVVESPVSGAFGLTTSGSGTVRLSGSNSFQSLTVASGVLELSDQNASGAGALAIASGGTLRVFSALAKNVANDGALVIGPGGSLAASSLGGGSISVAGTTGSVATLSSSLAAPLVVGGLTLGGNAMLGLTSGGAFVSSGAVTISGVDNVLSIAGASPAAGTYALVAGTSLVNTGAVSLTGAAFSGQIIPLGSSGTVGRTTYLFTSSGTALELVATGGPYDLVWSGGPAGTWNTTSANWQQGGSGPAITFVTADNVAFSEPATVTVDSGTAAAITAGNLLIGTTSGTVSLSGGGLVVSGSLAKAGAGGAELVSPIVIGQGLAVAAGTLTASGSLSITGGITISGGTTTLRASNAVSGTVGATGGTLVVHADTALGSAPVLIDGGRLVAGGSAATVGNPITVLAGGWTVEAGTDEFTGPLTVDGPLRLAGDARLGRLSGAATGLITNASSSGTATITTVFATGVTGTYAGTIADNGAGVVALVKTGTSTGDLVLTASNSFTGGTTTDSDIAIRSPHALGSGPIRTNGADARIYWDGTDAAVTIANDLVTGTSPAQALAFVPGSGKTVTLTGNISGSGQIKISSAATGILDLTAQTALTNTNTGGVEIGTGRVLIDDGTNLGTGNVNFGTGGNSVLLVGGSSVTVSNPVTMGSTVSTSSGTATIDTNGNSLVLAGMIADRAGNLPGGLTKLGLGELLIDGTGTYGGPTTVSAGTLRLDGALYAGSGTAITSVAAGAAVGGDGVLGGGLALASGANIVFDPAATLTVNGPTVTFGGFGIPNLLGLGPTTPEGTYVVVDGAATVDPTNLANVGPANAYDLGGGKSAYFGIGSLTVTIVPEPSLLAAVVAVAAVVPLIGRRRSGGRSLSPAARQRGGRGVPTSAPGQPGRNA